MEAIYNWSNHLIPDTKADMKRIASKIEARLDEGFNITQAVDLLLGEGENLSQIQDVVNYLNEQNKEEKTATSNRKIPVKYADVKDEIANLVHSMKPKDFVDMLASKQSLMSLSSKKYNNFRELVWYAHKHPEDPEIMDELHATVQPYIAQAIQDSQLLAKEAEEKNLFKFKKIASGDIKVKDGDAFYQVNLDNRTCTCPRYILCSFNMMKIPCEHIIEAARKFDENFNDELIGHKTVFAKKYDTNVRYAWCSRVNDEVVIEKSCVEAKCPFLRKDNGKTITCSFC